MKISKLEDGITGNNNRINGLDESRVMNGLKYQKTLIIPLFLRIIISNFVGHELFKKHEMIFLLRHYSKRGTYESIRYQMGRKI